MSSLQGGEFSRIPGSDARLQRAFATLARLSGMAVYGQITEVASDHLKVQEAGQGEIHAVDRWMGMALTALLLPPYTVGDNILIFKMKNPPNPSYPWADMTPGRFIWVPTFWAFMTLSMPAVTLTLTANQFGGTLTLSMPATTLTLTGFSCSISLPLLDTFTDSDGVTLATHAMDDGCGYTARAGALTDWTIASNQLRADAGSSLTSVYTLSDDTTHDSEMDVTIGTTATSVVVELWTRFVDTSNYWFGRIFVGTVAASSVLAIRERTSGTITERVTGTFTIAMGDEVTALFEDGNPGANDLLFSISGDATGSVTYNSSAHSGGLGAGFGVSHSGTITTKTLLDNFSVTN